MINTLKINSYSFRPPNSISTVYLDQAYQIKWDGMDGTTNFHKIIVGKKKAKNLVFNYLERYEFEFIESLINTGFVPIEYDLTDFAFSGNYLIEMNGYGDDFGGGKSNVNLLLTPQNLE